MAFITGSVFDSLGVLPFSLTAGTQLTMSIQNSLQGSSYFGLETIPNNDGFYTPSTIKNLSGSFSLGPGIVDVVYDDYKMVAIVGPGGGSLVYTPSVNISINSLWTKGTGAGLSSANFANLVASSYSTRVTNDGGVVESPECIISAIQSQPLYQSSSFLIIPSGYKSGVAYSEISTNDYGDLTWSRNSVANRTLANGIISQVAANVPRLSYMYGSCPALLLEPQRTNSLRNSTMQGAVAGTPGTLPTNWVSQATAGLTLEVASTGIENGLDYMDIRYSGTATSTTIRLFWEASNQIVAADSQIWTTSFYTSISGSALPSNYRLGVATNTSAGFSVSSIVATPNIPQTTTLTRYNRVMTLPGGATVARAQPGIYLTLVSGQTYDFTIRIAAPQFEFGQFVTTYINTTNAAATRLVDTFTRNNIYTNGLISASGGTWYVELKNNVAYTRDASGNTIWIGDTSGGGSNSFLIRNDTPSSAVRLRLVKSVSGSATTIYTTTTDTVKLAIKWNGTSADVFSNGTKVVSASSFTTTIMEFLAASGQQVPTFIQAMALYNQPLSDAECISLTTL